MSEDNRALAPVYRLSGHRTEDLGPVPRAVQEQGEDVSVHLICVHDAELEGAGEEIPGEVQVFPEQGKHHLAHQGNCPGILRTLMSRMSSR